MRKSILSLLILLFAVSLRAQTAPDGYEYVDSLVFIPLSAVDSTLDGRSIFSVLPDNVHIIQSSSIKNAIEDKTLSNAQQLINGYRIRIFFDNSQSARKDSEAALYRFKTHNANVPAFRTFNNPYFKVTVGNYRTRSEAMRALQTIRKAFPSAFIVREQFRFPALDNDAVFKVDTIKYLRKSRPEK